MGAPVLPGQALEARGLVSPGRGPHALGWAGLPSCMQWPSTHFRPSRFVSLLILAAVFFSVLLMLPAWAGGIPWLPTRRKDVADAIAIAEPSQGERFVDLGSGAGGVVRCAARQFGLVAEGVELLWPLWVIANVRHIFTRPGEGIARYRFGSLYALPLHGFDLVFLYGVGRSMPRLTEKLRQELRPGARLVSYQYRMAGLEEWLVADRALEAGHVFLYRVPGKSDQGPKS